LIVLKCSVGRRGRSALVGNPRYRRPSQR
jgi:hypothetical protein